MPRVGSSFSAGQPELGKNGVASRCPGVALTERNQVATLPVQLLRNDVTAVQRNGRAEASFQMKMDAHGFTPEELVVRVDGQNLIMTGQRHQESNGYCLEQSVNQQMQLPSNLDLAALTCSLTPSGYLWVHGQNKLQPSSGAKTGQTPTLRSRDSKGPNLP